MAKFFHFEVPQHRNPWTEWTQKVLGTTTFTSEHVCEISFRLLNIFEKLWLEGRIALDREEKEKKKRSQNNCLESHVWSQISGKPVERKIWFFF